MVLRWAWRLALLSLAGVLVSLSVGYLLSGRSLAGHGPHLGSWLTSGSAKLSHAILSVLIATAAVLLSVLVVVAVPAGVVIAHRVRRRRGRVQRWYALRLYRAEEPRPEQLAVMFGRLQRKMRPQWLRRLWDGPPSLTLRTLTVPSAEAAREGRRVIEGQLYVLCPESLAAPLDVLLRRCMPDSGLEPVEDTQLDPTKLGALVRLTKREVFTKRLGTPEHYEHATVDGLLGAMADIGEAMVDLTLVPAPQIAETRLAHWVFGGQERAAERRRRRWEWGRRSDLAQAELEGARRVIHRPLFIIEIRVIAPCMRDAIHIAAELQSSRAENELKERRLYARRRLYRDRILNARPNPTYHPLSDLMAPDELVGLWHPPTPRAKDLAVRRTTVPRIPAAPQVSRSQRSLGGKPGASGVRSRRRSARREPRMREHHDTVVIGGGQAGLAMSAVLQHRGREHVVVEREQVGERWRSERWESLRFQFPNWSLELPGYAYSGDEPKGFAHWRKVVRVIEDYAASARAPVREYTEVTGLWTDVEGLVLSVSDGTIHARHVVVDRAVPAPTHPAVVRARRAVCAADRPDALPGPGGPPGRRRARRGQRSVRVPDRRRTAACRAHRVPVRLQASARPAPVPRQGRLLVAGPDGSLRPDDR